MPAPLPAAMPRVPVVADLPGGPAVAAAWQARLADADRDLAGPGVPLGPGRDDAFATWAATALLRRGPGRRGSDALADVHRAHDALTPGLLRQVVAYDDTARGAMWTDLARSLAPHDADRAVRLVQRAIATTDLVSSAVKDQVRADRPFAVDPDLAPPAGIAAPKAHRSFPSGHASDAVAAAEVLAALVPAQADQLRAIALAVGWSRVAAGVHFPSDVADGAWLGRVVAAQVLAAA